MELLHLGSKALPATEASRVLETLLIEVFNFKYLFPAAMSPNEHVSEELFFFVLFCVLIGRS